MMTFGERLPQTEYIPRPGGYAIIERDGLIAVVTTPTGKHLPGGGIDRGETVIEGTLREVREECGFDVRIVREIAHADEYTYDRVDDVHYLKHCTFFMAERLGSNTYECEVDHTHEWLTPEEAASVLKFECQRWVVRQHALRA